MVNDLRPSELLTALAITPVAGSVGVAVGLITRDRLTAVVVATLLAFAGAMWLTRRIRARGQA